MSVDWEELNAKLPYQKNEVKKKQDKMKSVKILFLKNLEIMKKREFMYFLKGPYEKPCSQFFFMEYLRKSSF